MIGRFRVEEFDTVGWPMILEALGVRRDLAIPPVPKDYNSALKYPGMHSALEIPEFTWDDLRGTDEELAEAMIAQAKRYGYPCNGA